MLKHFSKFNAKYQKLKYILAQLKSRMKFSSGHGYAHPKPKKMFQRKAWVKLLKNSLKQYT